MKVDDAFVPPGEAWTRVSPRLITARRLSMSVLLIPWIAVLIWSAIDTSVPVWVFPVVGVVGLVGFAWAFVLIGRRVRSWGYAERADDLLVTSGIWRRRLVIVPYGRMQLVDLTAGPIDRLLGITTVQMHTAAAATDATIPGLLPAVASALRDRLAAHGETRSAGL